MGRPSFFFMVVSMFIWSPVRTQIRTKILERKIENFFVVLAEFTPDFWQVFDLQLVADGAMVVQIGAFSLFDTLIQHLLLE